MPKDLAWYLLGVIGAGGSGIIRLLWGKWDSERTERAKEVAALNMAHAQELAAVRATDAAECDKLRREHSEEMTRCNEARIAVIERGRETAERNGALLAKATEEIQQLKATNKEMLAVLKKERDG